jgi:hypothetical protein
MPFRPSNFGKNQSIYMYVSGLAFLHLHRKQGDGAAEPQNATHNLKKLSLHHICPPLVLQLLRDAEHLRHRARDHPLGFFCLRGAKSPAVKQRETERDAKRDGKETCKGSTSARRTHSRRVASEAKAFVFYFSAGGSAKREGFRLLFLHEGRNPKSPKESRQKNTHPTPLHRPALPAPRLPIRKDAHVVPVSAALRQLRDLREQVRLRRGGGKYLRWRDVS